MEEANKRLSKHLKSKDLEQALMADTDFHAVYIKLSNNKELEKILAEIKQKLNRLELYYFDQAKNSHLSYEEHEQIISALRKRDLPAALNAVEHNWKASFARIGESC
jgi:DNA-binding GntR family transcriptional regulator